jgi:hypothetical protein
MATTTTTTASPTTADGAVWRTARIAGVAAAAVVVPALAARLTASTGHD